VSSQDAREPLHSLGLNSGFQLPVQPNDVLLHRAPGDLPFFAEQLPAIRILPTR